MAVSLSDIGILAAIVIPVVAFLLIVGKIITDGLKERIERLEEQMSRMIDVVGGVTKVNELFEAGKLRLNGGDKH